ncbi:MULTISPECIES: AAA family ATPase [Rhodomicrobium]|uniref:AAA family ATPase n=1 Tax=Rhodomicrobium TaxID=1068 RepID=UPI001482814B|nr:MULTISPECIES: AAA family ATPase [Rhodomicrobium]
MKPAIAKALSAQLARDIGGRPAVDEPIPLPGTILYKTVGAPLVQRFPVQMMPALPTAYTIRDGELVDLRTRAAESPFLRAEEVEAKPLEWLWPGFIPIGALTLLGGAAGMGKSQAAISLAAALSSGGSWPTGERAEKGSALVLEAEDDVARTVTPRLMAAGAVLRRVGLGKALDLTQSLELLEAEAKRRGDLRLVVLSPIRKFFGDAELHGNLGVRAALDPILAWAERRRVAILGIAHPPKDKEHKEAFAGSTAFLELARAAYSVIPDPGDKNPVVKQKQRILVAAKNNLGADDVTLRYAIEGTRAGTIETRKVVWK